MSDQPATRCWLYSNNVVLFPGSDFSGAFRSEEDLKAMDEDIRKW